MDMTSESGDSPFSSQRAAQYRDRAASMQSWQKQGLPRNRSTSPHRPVPPATGRKAWHTVQMDRLASIEQDAKDILTTLDLPPTPSLGYDQVVITALDQAAAEHGHLTTRLHNVRSTLTDVKAKKQEVFELLCSLDSTISRLGSLVNQSPRPDLPDDTTVQPSLQVPTGKFSQLSLCVY